MKETIIRDKIKEDFVVDNECVILRGMIVGEIKVINGGFFINHGFVVGDILVDNTSDLIIHGTVKGSIDNHGKTEIYGTINGDIKSKEEDLFKDSDCVIKGTVSEN